MTEWVRRAGAAIWPPLAVAGLGLLLWQLGAQWSGVKPYLLPTPWAVATALVNRRAELAVAAWLTARCALTGFACCLLLGAALGILFAHSPLVRRGVYPYAVFLQTVPIVAIAPLIINWMGPGFSSIVLVVIIVGLFPVIANMTEGILCLDPSLRELFRLNRATRWQLIWKLEIPHAVPHLLTGARTSSGLSVIGAIVGEFFAGNTTRSHGLGFLIPQRIQWLRTDEAFAAVLVATLLGIMMFALVGGLQAGPLQRWCRR